MPLSERWRQSLNDLRSLGRYRVLRLAQGVDFTSNDYLGYAQIAWPDSGLSRSGAASRLLRGHHEIWDQCEAELARWHGVERVVIMNSGYVANEGLLATVIEPHDWVASDRLNHASIIDGLRLCRAEKFIFHHRDVNHLEEGLRTAHAARPEDRELFVVTESLFGMDGDLAPLKAIAQVCERYDAHLIVDEAHATGCYGDHGAGLVDMLKLRHQVLATVHTGGKALGVAGAYIAGNQILGEMLVNRCRHLIFTTSLPPIVGHWWLSALDKVRHDHEGRSSLIENARRFRSILAPSRPELALGEYIVPVQIGGDSEAIAVADRLARAGFDIRAIRPPTVPIGTARLRISVHADHSVDEIERAAQEVLAVLPSLK